MSNLKKLYDPVHGFIRFNEIESEFIDSSVFQRLRYIHQLGIAFLVYPGATHTRFEHSLGVMELASQIFDRIIEKYDPPTKPPDYVYWRQIVRFAALCHDLGHLPFSHVAESMLLGDVGHEKWSLEIIHSAPLKPIWEQLHAKFPHANVIDDVIKLAIGEHKLRQLGHAPFSNWERVVSQIISGDFFGADRIDYLIRDAKCTGVSYGIFDYQQLIEMLSIFPSLDRSGRLEFGIEENGIEACEALLLARYFMHKRVYKYSSVKACHFHLARFITKMYIKHNLMRNLETYLSVTDSQVLVHLEEAHKTPSNDAHHDAVCLLNRKQRFRAIEISSLTTERQLQELKEKLHIPSQSIGWELSKTHPSQTGLSFPVLARTGAICDAKHFSEIAIPSLSKSWLYVAPEYAKSIAQALESI